MVTITAPEAGSTVFGTITVRANVTVVGALTVAGVRFRVDGQNIGEDTSAPYSVSWNTTTVSNESHTLTAVARDLLGLQSTSPSVTVTVSNAPPPPPPPPPDTTLPTVGITAPLPEATVDETITITASVADNVGVTRVEFFRGSTLIGTDTTNTYAASWDTTTVANGSYALTARAWDAAGNNTTSAPVTVTVANAPPPDTTLPTVAITTPTAGFTATGTVHVLAEATDNVGIVGVQFKLDGIPLGVEERYAPYEVFWDTTTASNGSHTLTAVARDAAGNRRTSAGVGVTVANGDTTLPTVVIVEPANVATVSDTVHILAEATDNIGVVGVQFQLNGVNLCTEERYVPYECFWDTTQTGNGPHTLTAVARDAAGNSRTSAPITVSVSNAPPPSGDVTRHEETDPSITYSCPSCRLTPFWLQNTAPSWSGGAVVFSEQATSQADFAFTGTSVSWIGLRGPLGGIARVFLDGVLAAELDLYSPTEEFRSVVFTARGLSNATHVLTIEVTGMRNPAATSAYVVVDAFDVPAPRVTRVQETDPSVALSEGWTAGDRTRQWSGGTAAVARTAPAQATLTFTGTSVTWIGFRGPQAGIARVLIDGTFVAEIDMYSATEQVQAPVFTATGLTHTTHTLTIEVTGLRNPAATDTLIVVDAFEVAAPP